MEHENLRRERDHFARMDEYGAQYIDDWADELGHEMMENEMMSVEEDYQWDVVISKGTEEFRRLMEVYMMEAQEAMRMAMTSMKRIKEVEAVNYRHSMTMRQNSARIERVATDKSREVLMRMGVIHRAGVKYHKPMLRPLPPHHDTEALEEYFYSMKVRHAGGLPPTSIDLDSNVDVTQLHGEAKQRFVRNVAKTMGVEDSQVKLVLGLPDTPHPTPRRRASPPRNIYTPRRTSPPRPLRG